MSNSATWTKPPGTSGTKAGPARPSAEKPAQSQSAAAPKQAAATRPSWKDTFAFPAYSGLLEIV